MNRSYVYKTFAIFCVSFLIVYAAFVATHFWQKKEQDSISSKVEEKPVFSNLSFIKQNTKTSDPKHLTRVEIEVKDDILSPNGKIISVRFNDDNINLNPSDHYGRRGSTFMHLLPGFYTIEWIVKNNPHTTPTEHKQTKQIEIKASDLWIHVLIEGKNININ